MKKKPMENPETQYRTIGKTTIDPEVLVTIARLTALDVPGVSRMAAAPRAKDRFFSRSGGEGIRLEIQDDQVLVDLFLVLKNDVNILQVSRQVQSNVARSISEMVGMNTGQINIHVEDIDFSTEGESL
jgi:uncharacterized alkaline shock family protein YloU